MISREKQEQNKNIYKNKENDTRLHFFFLKISIGKNKPRDLQLLGIKMNVSEKLKKNNNNSPAFDIHIERIKITIDYTL